MLDCGYVEKCGECAIISCCELLGLCYMLNARAVVPLLGSHFLHAPRQSEYLGRQYTVSQTVGLQSFSKPKRHFLADHMTELSRGCADDRRPELSHTHVIQHPISNIQYPPATIYPSCIHLPPSILSIISMFDLILSIPPWLPALILGLPIFWHLLLFLRAREERLALAAHHAFLASHQNMETSREFVLERIMIHPIKVCLPHHLDHVREVAITVHTDPG